MALLQITLLGGLRVAVGDSPPLALPRRKAQAPVAYPAVSPGVAYQREKLAALLWPDAGAEQALGKIARASGALDEARRWYEDALATFDGCQARFEVGRTMLALAELTGQTGELGDAARHLGEAERVFSALGVPRYEQRARALAERLGLDRPRCDDGH